MKRGIIILSLLCLAILTNGVVNAQFFQKKKVAIWEIRDEVDSSVPVRTQIAASLTTAITNSNNYDAFSVTFQDVMAFLQENGLQQSKESIASAAKQVCGADYVIFSSLKYKRNSDFAAQRLVNLQAEFYNCKTKKVDRMAEVDMHGNMDEIPKACEDLANKLLCENPNFSENGQQRTVKKYKIGDIYDVNGKKGVVFAVTPDGLHGKILCLTQPEPKSWESAVSWSRTLRDWHIATSSELKEIFLNKNAIKSILVSMGDDLGYAYWTTTEYNKREAWYIRMTDGCMFHAPKRNVASVRAVYTF